MTEKKKPNRKSKRGFASMTPEKRRQIASMGGSAVPDEARSFSRDPRLASKAGQLGGSKRFTKTPKPTSDEPDSRS